MIPDVARRKKLNQEIQKKEAALHSRSKLPLSYGRRIRAGILVSLPKLGWTWFLQLNSLVRRSEAKVKNDNTWRQIYMASKREWGENREKSIAGGNEKERRARRP